MAIYGEVEKEIATISGLELNIEKKSIEGQLIDGFKIKSNGDEGVVTIKNGRVFLRGIELVYSQSSDSMFHIHQINDAQGRTHESALKKARNIRCAFEFHNNHMFLETMYFQRSFRNSLCKDICFTLYYAIHSSKIKKMPQLFQAFKVIKGF